LQRSEPEAIKRSEPEAIDRFILNPCEESFSDLFRAFAPRLVAWYRVRGCDKALAEDLTQEVMLAVFRQARNLRNAGLFRPWLYRIVKNALLQHVRRSGRRIETVALNAAEAGSATKQADPLLPAQFAEWMAFLDEEEREIMMLRYVDELEYHEIAQTLDMPQGTVQWKIFNAKKKLAARFKPRRL
jgi:RNA polymerase sigma-70 factor (ECF subfamily)